MKRYMVLILLYSLLVSQAVSFSNSAEPPSVVIIVPNAPDDMQINLQKEGDVIFADVKDKTIERHFEFYYRQLPQKVDYVFYISYGSERFEVELESVPNHYNNIYTLNLKDKSLIPGKLKIRTVVLITARVTLTLILEGAIFWFFAFRKKESWTAFLLINLMTQIALNIWISGFPITIGYSIIGLFFAEIVIVIFEMALFLRLVKEYTNIRKAGFVFVANIVSFVAGGYMITLLPF